MAQSTSRTIGWIVLGDVCLVLIIIVFGLALGAIGIPIERHPVLAVLLGPHGVLFNFVLPGLIVLFIPLSVVWAIVLLVAFFKGQAKSGRSKEG